MSQKEGPQPVKKFFKKKPKSHPPKDSQPKEHTPKDTSWQKSSAWYDQIVGEKGHYYHQHVILPKILPLFKNPSEDSLLDLACGQGILGRQLPNTPYQGVDLSSALIQKAKQYDQSPGHRYQVGDISKPLKIDATFSHASIILAIQNIREPLKAFQQAAKHLKPGGKLMLVLNHPCFRIPRQSSWEVDLPNQIQYRRINRYHSSMEIPIQTHPGQKEQSENTLSFHHPLSEYFRWLKEAGFVVELLDEWYSDKESEGGRARMENASRFEIPLFLFLLAAKKEL
ncbi:MAG: hypothetical protein K0S07_341 [Chlamydiales bacterium]|jgi:SAM-dependent methyltransferase|nr:hypothetical protein [Chlamydiales bacterium]